MSIKCLISKKTFLIVAIAASSSVLNATRKLFFWNNTKQKIEIQVNYKKSWNCSKSHNRFSIAADGRKEDSSDVCSPVKVSVRVEGKEVLNFKVRSGSNLFADHTDIKITEENGQYSSWQLDRN